MTWIPGKNVSTWRRTGGRIWLVGIGATPSRSEVGAAMLGWAYFAFIHQPGIPPEPWINY